MDEHHPRRGLLDLPYDVHTIISGLVDATSRLSFVSCSKRARLLWMHAVFKKIRLEGTQTELVDDLMLYLADRSTLVDHLRHGLKSLTIIVHVTPVYMRPHGVTWENLLDLPRKHRYKEYDLPGLIWDVLALNLTDFNSFQRWLFTEDLYPWGGFPKVKHLRVVGLPMLASTVICRCTTKGGLDSLHLYSGISSESVQIASRCQQSLKRLSLLIDTNVNVTDLPTEHLDRVNPTMRPALLMDIARHFPTLEWLVLGPSCINAPRPFNTQSEHRFFEKHARLFLLAIKSFPTLKRIAFALPDAQIGNRIVRGIYDGSEPIVTSDERDNWSKNLIDCFMKDGLQLQQVRGIGPTFFPWHLSSRGFLGAGLG
ncbi:uncharacterized protein NECHADRAFT_78568 [Fusarium vanettenii 77-13-4]|uniref:F-box domain-containing protein n=1 Tax=Fusarium vanettenii (strain ATCC MYA-4622 / CBS 123669 / FGSC 9596 / NRRL 45880 / 77-13-4) TaxID=660122 RepID=C7ZLV5_FUSV7|nr:uncharacterized protein NECHADRAFT_78568 [Fusarium vanettenii 77-13-4]EEU35030.1 predicted protein [Fusarium vanettenii 77-13-4]